MRILHVITTLSVGGAETMLRNVALGLPRNGFEQRVISLTTRDPIGGQLEAGGIPVLATGTKGGRKLPALLMQARQLVAQWRPDVIHAWMYHANVFARVLIGLTSAGTRPAFVASVRGALNSPRAQRRVLRMVRWVDARSSRYADALLFNSRVSASQHHAIGYLRDRSLVIPNGFDTNTFAPDARARQHARAALGIDNEFLIGMVARYEPVKGHEIMLKAARSVVNDRPQSRFAFAGRGCDANNHGLARLVSEFGLSRHVILLGERRDVPELINAFDLAVCPSLSESFPNAVGEAMSCGVPCVVTDVGDCAMLVGDTGIVAPPADPETLAMRIKDFIDMEPAERASMGLRARNRIVQEFSLDAVLLKYAALYDRLMAAPRGD
jgi:glycosyltransferase involved in cell wall biosynthesis